jgi:hypothetical protein
MSGSLLRVRKTVASAFAGAMVIAGVAAASIAIAPAAEPGPQFATDEATMRPAVKVFDAVVGLDGSGQRVPPWLIETEDVWGLSSAVSAT